MFWAHVSPGNLDLSERCFTGEEEGRGGVKRRSPVLCLCSVRGLTLRTVRHAACLPLRAGVLLGKALESSGRFWKVPDDCRRPGPTGAQDPALSGPRFPPPTQQPPLRLLARESPGRDQGPSPGSDTSVNIVEITRRRNNHACFSAARPRRPSPQFQKPPSTVPPRVLTPRAPRPELR